MGLPKFDRVHPIVDTEGVAGPTGPVGPPGPAGPTGPTGAGGAPSGPAGGDLTGTYPNPQVDQLTGAANIVTLIPTTTIQQTQPATVPASVVGTADITAAGLYGGGGTLNGKTLILSVNQQGLSTLNLNGATNTANEAALLLAIINKVAWAGIGAVQGGPGGNKLVLSASINIAVDAGSTALAQLGLVAGTSLFTSTSPVALEIVPASGAPFKIRMNTSAGQAANEFDNGWSVGLNVFGEDPAFPTAGIAIEDSFNGNFEFYAQFAGVAFANSRRFFAYTYTKATGATTSYLAAVDMSIGDPVFTGTLNHYSSVHQWSLRDPGAPTTVVPIYFLSYPFGVNTAAILAINPAAPLTVFGITMNGAGQRLSIQASLGTLQLSATTGQLANTDESAAVLIWDSASRSIQIGNVLALGSGSQVVGVADALVVPTTNPAGGGILYSTGGQGAWRRSTGVVIGFG